MSTALDAVRTSAEYWASSVRFNNSLALVAFTVLYYDYSLTLFDEIEFFWKSANRSLVTVLFVINRYLGLLGPIPTALEYFTDLPEKACSYYIPDEQIATPLPFTYTGCDLSLTNDQGIHLTIAWGAMLWFDTTIFVLTLVQALRMRRHFPGGLLEIMFRDGTIYYGIMLAANVSNIITFMITRSGSPLKGMDTTLTNVLSTTLTSRLILNLRNPALHRNLQLGENTTAASAWDTTTALETRSVTIGYRFTEGISITVDTQASNVERV
ncbi:hypothetical protein BD413DRAFT_608031 [Trametes elegans]|nr:hypothetical protein BD413DRAFT_608031 [Trametes elegans]